LPLSFLFDTSWNAGAYLAKGNFQSKPTHVTLGSATPTIRTFGMLSCFNL